MGLYRKLQEYDLQNQTRYCSQILMYLKCDCNATHAAEQMYLHRNTVRKAVQFVEDTWQVELRDTEIKKQMVMGELVDQYLAWKTVSVHYAHLNTNKYRKENFFGDEKHPAIC